MVAAIKKCKLTLRGRCLHVEEDLLPPALFDVTSRGPTHLDLSWEPPYEENGVLVGYNISYQSSERSIPPYRRAA